MAKRRKPRTKFDAVPPHHRHRNHNRNRRRHVTAGHRHGHGRPVAMHPHLPGGPVEPVPTAQMLDARAQQGAGDAAIVLADATGWHGSVHDPSDVHDAVYGQLDPRFPPIDALIVVNPAESPPTGWGAENSQQFQSGHTNNRPTNESSEQGFGVGPERLWPHYPHAVQYNAYRHANALLRDGQYVMGDVYKPEVAAYWAQALTVEQTAQPTRQVGRSGVVNQTPSVPYVATVPPVNPGGY